jgi:hypothetical protein
VEEGGAIVNLYQVYLVLGDFSVEVADDSDTLSPSKNSASI